MVPTAAGGAPVGRPRRRAPNWGVTPWQDPHNADPQLHPGRLRAEVLPLLEDVLGGGVAEALARTATALQEDGDVLDDPRRRGRWPHAQAGGAGLSRRRADAAAGAVRRRVDPELAAGRRGQCD